MSLGKVYPLLHSDFGGLFIHSTNIECLLLVTRISPGAYSSEQDSSPSLKEHPNWRKICSIFPSFTVSNFGVSPYYLWEYCMRIATTLTPNSHSVCVCVCVCVCLKMCGTLQLIWKIVWQFLKMLNIVTLCTSNSTPGFIPKRNESICSCPPQKNLCSGINVWFFIIAKRQKQPKCLPTNTFTHWNTSQQEQGVDESQKHAEWGRIECRASYYFISCVPRKGRATATGSEAAVGRRGEGKGQGVRGLMGVGLECRQV